MSITAQSIVKKTQQHVATDLKDEVVILHFGDRIYYGLNATGAFIWKKLARPASVQALCEAVLAEYDVEAERCQAEVIRLLDELLAHSLIEIAE
jgi:hypothetical protein